jgi:hypothetical protein
MEFFGIKPIKDQQLDAPENVNGLDEFSRIDFIMDSSLVLRAEGRPKGAVCGGERMIISQYSSY